MTGNEKSRFRKAADQDIGMYLQVSFRVVQRWSLKIYLD